MIDRKKRRSAKKKQRQLNRQLEIRSIDTPAGKTGEDMEESVDSSEEDSSDSEEDSEEQDKSTSNKQTSQEKGDNEEGTPKDANNTSKDNNCDTAVNQNPKDNKLTESQNNSKDYESYSPFLRKGDRLNTAFIQGMEDDSIHTNDDDKRYLSFDLQKETEKNAQSQESNMDK
jgi:hypothetical protein